MWAEVQGGVLHVQIVVLCNLILLIIIVQPEEDKMCTWMDTNMCRNKISETNQVWEYYYSRYFFLLYALFWMFGQDLGCSFFWHACCLVLYNDSFWKTKVRAQLISHHCCQKWRSCDLMTLLYPLFYYYLNCFYHYTDYFKTQNCDPGHQQTGIYLGWIS